MRRCAAEWLVSLCVRWMPTSPKMKLATGRNVQCGSKNVAVNGEQITFLEGERESERVNVRRRNRMWLRPDNFTNDMGIGRVENGGVLLIFGRNYGTTHVRVPMGVR